MKIDLKAHHAMLEHVHSGKKKQVKVGYSWTLMLFGCFVPLFRKDWLTLFSLMLACSFLYAIIPDSGDYRWVSILLFIVFGFYYNDLYLKRALKGDWVPADAASRNRLYEKGLVRTHCYDQLPKEDK